MFCSKRRHPRIPWLNTFLFQGYLGRNYFIATQSPLPNTINDFWRLVHSQKSSTIVLLNNVKDRTVGPYIIKCTTWLCLFFIYHSSNYHLAMKQWTIYWTSSVATCAADCNIFVYFSRSRNSGRQPEENQHNMIAWQCSWTPKLNQMEYGLESLSYPLIQYVPSSYYMLDYCGLRLLLKEIIIGITWTNLIKYRIWQTAKLWIFSTIRNGQTIVYLQMEVTSLH
jgi:hypothetical protein